MPGTGTVQNNSLAAEVTALPVSRAGCCSCRNPCSPGFLLHKECPKWIYGPGWNTQVSVPWSQVGSVAKHNRWIPYSQSCSGDTATWPNIPAPANPFLEEPFGNRGQEGSFAKNPSLPLGDTLGTRCPLTNHNGSHLLSHISPCRILSRPVWEICSPTEANLQLQLRLLRGGGRKNKSEAQNQRTFLALDRAWWDSFP